MLCSCGVVGMESGVGMLEALPVRLDVSLADGAGELPRLFLAGLFFTLLFGRAARDVGLGLGVGVAGTVTVGGAWSGLYGSCSGAGELLVF